MLILSRKPEESVMIQTQDGSIEIVVTEIATGKVRLGISAPHGCKILRKELVQTMEYNLQAANKPSTHLKDLMAKFKDKD